MATVRPGSISADEAATLALQCLAAMLSDDALARRFLALTGLTPDGLRACAGEDQIARATFQFLLDHEPSLLAICQRIACPPARIARAAAVLAGPQIQGAVG